MHALDLSDAKVQQFRSDGFIVYDQFLEGHEIEAARSRFEPLFRGEWETGIPPDEINWTEGRDDPANARQLCNTWRSNYTIASLVLRPEIGEVAARMAGWPGTRIHLDNVIWKPPGTSAFAMHQDGSWNHYLVPNNMCSLWMALDETKADAGTVEYVRGSNHWHHSPKPEVFRIDDYQRYMREAAAQAGIDNPEVVPVEVSAGGLAVHDRWCWHGSGPNTEQNRMRRSLVAHCTNSETEFHPTATTHLYARYRKRDTTEMDESFFPILWREDGYRTPWLDDYMAKADSSAAA